MTHCTGTGIMLRGQGWPGCSKKPIGKQSDISLAASVAETGAIDRYQSVSIRVHPWRIAFNAYALSSVWESALRRTPL
jgi:hypothetical protein